MDVLILTPTPSHPQNQGNRKGVYAFTKEFEARGANIHFLYVPSEWYSGFSPAEHKAMSQEWDYFHVIPPSSKIGFTPNEAGMDIDCIWYDAIETTINWWKQNVRFDAVVCHYVFLSKVLTLFPNNVYKILYTHDKFSDRHNLLSQNQLAPDYFYTTIAEESRAFDRADLIVAVKETEAEQFKTMTTKDVVTIGHAGNAYTRRLTRSTDGRLRVGFIGSENAVNRSNLSRFFEEFGEELARRDDLAFVIAGKICDQWTSELPNVQLIGRVDALQEFYNHVDVVFIPFEFSTGIKIKAIEAMAFGTAVLMTANAADGIPTDCPSHLLSDRCDVKDAIVSLCDNRDGLVSLEQASQVVYDAIHQQIQDRIDQVFQTIRSNRKWLT